jgi:hypothetical protein
VVDEESLADACTGMDLDAGQEARYVGCEPGQEKEIVPPEEVGYAVQPDGMKAWIAGYYL